MIKVLEPTMVYLVILIICVSSVSFTFIPSATGTRTMIFDNTRIYFAETITRTLDYQIEQKILQITQKYSS